MRSEDGWYTHGCGQWVHDKLAPCSVCRPRPETKCPHEPCACQDAGMHNVVGCDFVGHRPQSLRRR